MPLRIVRNDITKMQVDVIVNTANSKPKYSSGTDSAVYKAAGEYELLAERKKIGKMKAGEVAITSGFKLPAKYIIHAVSPRYIDGGSKEEERLRDCYRKSLDLAVQYKCKSIAFPLISTGCFSYPKEEGMRVALDEINAFLLKHDMLVYIVVFDNDSTKLGLKLYPDLKAYIDHNYVCDKSKEEYGDRYVAYIANDTSDYDNHLSEGEIQWEGKVDFDECYEDYEVALKERIEQMTDSFSKYLMDLIRDKKLDNSKVYGDVYISKQLFHKIKSNPNYHPKKSTVLRLCIGAKLNLDESKELLARAGYALSSCDLTDVIFAYFIEKEIFDMLEIDIVLEKFGLPCFID